MFSQNVPEYFSYSANQEGSYLTVSVQDGEMLLNIRRQPDDLTQASLTIPMTPEQAAGLRDFLKAATQA